MTYSEAKEKLKELFAAVVDDYSAIEEFVKANREEFEDIAEEAFRMAVKGGHRDYVSKHAGSVELNDCGDSSSYLDDAPDREMKELLFELGAFRSWEDYDGYSLAIETVNWTVLSFDEDFQQEVYEKFLEKSGFSEDDIVACLEGDEDEDEEEEDSDAPEEFEGWTLEEICEMLHVEAEDGEVSLEEFSFGDEAGDLKELVEALGWKLDFEGTSWKLDTSGVYFIE